MTTDPVLQYQKSCDLISYTELSASSHLTETVTTTIWRLDWEKVRRGDFLQGKFLWMKARSLLRNPISIFVLFAILFLIKSRLFRDILISPSKILQLWQGAEGKLWTTRNLMAFPVFMNIHALPYKRTNLTTLQDSVNTHPAKTLALIRNKNY